MVSKEQAQSFDTYWESLDRSPGVFNILGGNCSTHASDAFIKAGILGGGIPGLDTPNNLYYQLYREQNGKCSGMSGYIGFSRAPSGAGYLLLIDTA